MLILSQAPLWVGIDMTKMPPAALQIFLNKDVIAVDQDPLGMMATCRNEDGCPPPRSAHGPSHADHKQLTLVPCTAAPAYIYDPTNSITGGGSLANPTGDVLTAQSCAGTGPGDPLIGGYPAVAGSCHQKHNGNKTDSPTNQAVKMVALTGSKVKGAMEIQMEQDGMCVAADAALAVATAKCGSGAHVPPGQGWVWSAKKLQSLTWPTKCLGDGSAPGPGPPPPPAANEGQVWARPLKSADGDTKVAIMLFNPGEATANITATWSQVGLPADGTATVIDLWSKKSSQLTQLSAEVPSHGGVIVTAAHAKQQHPDPSAAPVE